MQAFLERYGKSLAVAFGLGLLFVLLTATSPAGAVSTDAIDRAEDVRSQARDRAQGVDDAAENAQEKREAAQERLEGRMLEICQKREQRVQNIMARIADRGQKQLNVFTTIADRVQNFYTDADLRVENYADLVAEVDSKQAAAEAAVTAVKEASVDFNCEGNDPKGVANAFRGEASDMIEALKEHRTAVKDLLVAVKTAVGEQNNGSADDSEPAVREEGAS